MKRKYVIGIIALIVFMFSSLPAKTQRFYIDRDLDILLDRWDSDTLGGYDLNVIVLGIVEIDSLIRVWKTPDSWGYGYRPVYTTLKNLPLIVEYKNHLESLIYRNDFFDMECQWSIIRYFIYPQCSEDVKKRLDSVHQHVRSFEFLCPTCDTTINLCEDIKYEKLIGKNEYLLVVMNRTWEETRIIWEHDPIIRPDESNTYVKFLIPLYIHTKK